MDQRGPAGEREHAHVPEASVLDGRRDLAVEDSIDRLAAGVVVIAAAYVR